MITCFDISLSFFSYYKIFQVTYYLYVCVCCSWCAEMVSHLEYAAEKGHTEKNEKKIGPNNIRIE